ncbi:MAG: arginine--tRNA ligase [Rhodospirillaceae bacterium]|nr:arginine--tRNA ligase [Rhodospirillaceae bacterium]
MNVFNTFRATIEEIVAGLAASGDLPDGLDTSHISVEPPRDPTHGDISTNIAMVLAKPAKMTPRDLAEKIADGLKSADGVEAVDVAGPGFINLRLSPGLWQEQVSTILETGEGYGDTDLGAGQTTNVEYVSANPTGPMHVGHARGAVIGDVLGGLLSKAGFDVTREYYINDAGVQIDVLARSAYLRYREALGEDIGEIPSGLYPGDYLVAVGKALADEHGDKLKSLPEEEMLSIVRNRAIDDMMVLIRDDLAALGIEHDVFMSERVLHSENRIDDVVAELEKRDLVYWGTLEAPKGKKPDDWEEREQYLFRSTQFADDIDRPLKKSDGSWTYFAADVAYHLDKYRRGFAEMVDVWGADHKGYIKRMEAAVKATTNGQGVLDVRICSLVNLFENGEPVRMSKRAGTFVTLREVVDQVGKDVVRFMMLTRSNDAPLDFDLKLALEQSRDNPVFYVQYAHARACSVLRNALGSIDGISVDDSSLAKADMSLLSDEAELSLIRVLAGWPRLVETAAVAREPHRIAYFLNDVAAEFHGLWNKGNEDVSLRFIVPDNMALTESRLALVRAMAVVIASGLSVMGVRPVEEMH